MELTIYQNLADLFCFINPGQSEDATRVSVTYVRKVGNVWQVYQAGSCDCAVLKPTDYVYIYNV